MFTIADIRNIAIQIERNGEKSYRQAAQAVKDPELRAMFVRMADDEKRHGQWFEKFKESRALSAEQREMEAVGKTILQEMVRDRTFSLDRSELESVDNLEELLITSRGFEEDTILFYEMLSGFIEDSVIRRQLQEIIAEEQHHAEELQKLPAERQKDH
jgi:rubrerythrin